MLIVAKMWVLLLVLVLEVPCNPEVEVQTRVRSGFPKK